MRPVTRTRGRRNFGRVSDGPLDAAMARFSSRAQVRLVVLKRVDDDDDRWSHEDDEQGREDTADHREEHFQGRLCGLLLRSLTTAAPHLFRLDAEHFRDTDA